MVKKSGCSVGEIQALLPEGWEIVERYYREGSEYAIVKIKVDDLKKTSIRLVKLPPEVREYLRQKQRNYRAKQKEQNSKSTRKEVRK